MGLASRYIHINEASYCSYPAAGGFSLHGLFSRFSLGCNDSILLMMLTCINIGRMNPALQLPATEICDRG